MGKITRSPSREVADPRDRTRAKAVGRLLEAWFAKNGRDFAWRHWRDPYRVAVTESLLQRTRAGVVDGFVPSFFADYPHAQALLAESREDLEIRLTPLGLQRRRTIALRAIAGAIACEDSQIAEGTLGVGQYIGRAVAVSTSGAPLAMVDANFVRVLKRVFAGPWRADYRWDGRLQDLAQNVVTAPRDARTTNWAILDLGAMICVPRRPKCVLCPLRDICDVGTKGIR